MKRTLFFCVLALATSSLFSAADSNKAPKKPKTWISRMLGRTSGSTATVAPSSAQLPRTVSFTGRPNRPEERMSRSQSAPQPISDLAQSFIPSPLPTRLHEHLFCACYNFLQTQIERLPETTITNSFLLRIQLHQLCSPIQFSDTEEKPLEILIKDAFDTMRLGLAALFYAYIMETIYKEGLPRSVYNAFYNVYNEIMHNQALSENLSIRLPTMSPITPPTTSPL
jgi:hypothetical protein